MKPNTADNLTKLAVGTLQAFDTADQLCATAATAITSCTTTPAGTTKYAHDARGNRTTVAPPSDPVTTLTLRMGPFGFPHGLHFRGCTWSRPVLG